MPSVVGNTAPRRIDTRARSRLRSPATLSYEFVRSTCSFSVAAAVRGQVHSAYIPDHGRLGVGATLAGHLPARPPPGWTRPLLPPTRLLLNLRTDGFCQGRLGVYMNHAPLTGSGCPTVTDGLDRFRESNILLRRVGGRPPTFPPAYRRPEAKSHRSRTVSLGIGQIMADEDAEQPPPKTRSSRD